MDVGVRIVEQREYSSGIGSATAWLIRQECRDGEDVPSVFSMGKYFIKETWNKKIKLKSKHEHLTQCHMKAIFNFLSDHSTCFHHRQLFE